MRGTKETPRRGARNSRRTEEEDRGRRARENRQGERGAQERSGPAVGTTTREPRVLRGNSQARAEDCRNTPPAPPSAPSGRSRRARVGRRPGGPAIGPVTRGGNLQRMPRLGSASSALGARPCGRGCGPPRGRSARTRVLRGLKAPRAARRGGWKLVGERHHSRTLICRGARTGRGGGAPWGVRRATAPAPRYTTGKVPAGRHTRRRARASRSPQDCSGRSGARGHVARETRGDPAVPKISGTYRITIEVRGEAKARLDDSSRRWRSWTAPR